MTLRSIINTIFGILISCCVYSQKLTIAFTEISSLEKGAMVYASGQQVGYVTNITPNKDLDTLFVIIKINRGIKIPKGSQFFLDENLIGPSGIRIEYSQQKQLLTSKDISIGSFRPLKTMKSTQFDSTLDIKKLRSPKVDTIKHR